MEGAHITRGYLVVSQNGGYLFGGPHNKGYTVLGSILGFPISGKYHFCGLLES